MSSSRRRFVQGLMLGCVGLSAGAYSSRRVLHPRVADKIPSLGPATAQNQPLALAKYFPTLVDPRAKSGPLIINSFDGRGASLVGRGEPGNAIFVAPGHDRAIIPWTPLFAREQTILRPPQSVTRKLGGADLLVWNESSREHSIYGNKARKYEFMLPNLQWSKVRRTATVGAVSSNHVLQFALANRLADLTGSGEPLNSELDLVLFEVPGVPTDERRLAILQQLSPRVVVASNMFGLAGEIAYELANRQMDTHPQALIPPGGSNELSVLGHMNAVADLAQALETSQAWNAPPDVIEHPNRRRGGPRSVLRVAVPGQPAALRAFRPGQRCQACRQSNGLAQRIRLPRPRNGRGRIATARRISAGLNGLGAGLRPAPID